jgi:hypothetical protein
MRTIGVLLVLGAVFPACGGSPTAPVVPRTASLTITSFTISGEWSAQTGANALHGVITTTLQAASQSVDAYRYAITIGLHETAGVGVMVSAVDLTWFGAAGPFGTTHFDKPLLDSYANHIGAYGTAYTKTLAITDNDPSHPAATRVEAKFTFVDDNQHAGAITGAADVGSVSVPMPVISAFTADRATIDPGQSTTLRWTIANAASASIDNGVGAVAATGGSVTVSPTADPTTYQLTATNPAGSVSATVKVAVAYLPAVTFTTDQPSILVGDCAVLRWSITYATSASIDNGEGSVAPTTGTIAVCPTRPVQAPTSHDPSTTYTLTATNAHGSVSATTTITVVPDVEYRFFNTDDPAQYDPFLDHLGYMDPELGHRIDHDMIGTASLPTFVKFWGVRPGQSLSADVWVIPGKTRFCVTVQILRRGQIYKQGDTCSAHGWVQLTGTF